MWIRVPLPWKKYALNKWARTSCWDSNWLPCRRTWSRNQYANPTTHWCLKLYPREAWPHAAKPAVNILPGCFDLKEWRLILPAEHETLLSNTTPSKATWLYCPASFSNLHPCMSYLPQDREHSAVSSHFLKQIKCDLPLNQINGRRWVGSIIVYIFESQTLRRGKTVSVMAGVWFDGNATPQDDITFMPSHVNRNELSSVDPSPCYVFSTCRLHPKSEHMHACTPWSGWPTVHTKSRQQHLLEALRKQTSSMP